MSTDTILLVDEFHEFFFQNNIQIHEGKIISHINKLMIAKRVIGLSATFRGDNGLDKITSILTDS